ncbi:myc proto-oncogene protein-like isoform X2 [Macrobrachium rosenbergii]|uniref:myc proto-oncogene protein-like isoform X2 n=1 Tax=Macrobrachium rosenbergii TaxID=79674 RepID=UPI0034D4EB48
MFPVANSGSPLPSQCPRTLTPKVVGLKSAFASIKAEGDPIEYLDKCFDLMEKMTQEGNFISPPMMIELDPDSVWSHDEPSICSENWKSQEGPTLSNDIWSKFDLLLTPPRTPLRDADCIDLGSLPEDLNIGAIDLPLLEEDDLEVNLDFLDLDVNLPLELTGVNTIDFTPGVVCSHGQVRDTCTSCEKLALAGSELRHDCMWIGTCTAEAHANQKNRIHHDSTCSHISDLLSDSHGSLEVVTRFTQLDDFRDHDDEDDSQLDHDDDDALDCNPMPRPDTPSESSETDSDEELENPRSNDYDAVHEEVVYTSGSPSSTGLVHSDHTYHCMPPPSPKGSPVKSQTQLVPSYLHTPSDSEDEIDVVSVGGNSKESAYSCSTRPAKRSSNSSSNGSGGNKKNRNMVLSCTSEGAKKIFRIHTSTTTLPSTSLRSSKKVVHESPAECVKLKARKGSGKAAKRLLQQQQQQQQRGNSGGPRKRGSPRADVDDPDKREIHNSLERLRRVDLRNAFEELRVLVPDLVGKEKAPKVEILKKAAQYCHVIQEEERNFLAQIERERKYNSNLIKRLHALQRR